MITGAFKFVIALNSNQRPTDIAIGLAYGFWLALIPMNSLFWITLLILASFFKINQGAVIVAAILFKFVIWPFTSLLDDLGWLILSQESLHSFFTLMKNTPIIPWTRFYNSVVMGALALGPFLAIPLAIIFYYAVLLYRKQIRDRLVNSKFVQFISKFVLIRKLIDKYQKVKSTMVLFQ